MKKIEATGTGNRKGNGTLSTGCALSYSRKYYYYYYLTGPP